MSRLTTALRRAVFAAPVVALAACVSPTGENTNVTPTTGPQTPIAAANGIDTTSNEPHGGACFTVEVNIPFTRAEGRSIAQQVASAVAGEIESTSRTGSGRTDRQIAAARNTMNAIPAVDFVSAAAGDQASCSRRGLSQPEGRGTIYATGEAHDMRGQNGTWNNQWNGGYRAGM